MIVYANKALTLVICYDISIPMKLKIGDWIKPSDDYYNGIHYGYNNRLIIAITEPNEPTDPFIRYNITTVCEAFGIEENIWNEYNTEFIARVVLGE